MASPIAPAHGIGGATDLPIPLPLAVAAGTAALVISFGVLALAWRTPRYDGHDPGRPLPRPLAHLVDHPALRWFLRVLGLVVFGYVTWALVAGPDRVTNPVFGVFYVLVWVGLVPASLLFGPMVRAVSPLRTLHLLLTGLTGADPARGLLPWPAWLGCWPASLGLFAFVWQELCNPNSAYLVSIRLWLAIYAAVLLLGAALLGDRWFAAADPFEVFGSLVARLSPWGRDVTGAAVRRSPLAQLARTPLPPGLVAVVAVLFGSTGFDSFKDTQRWLRLSAHLPGSETAQLTLGLTAFCVIVALSFSAVAVLTGVLGDVGDVRLTRLPRIFAPSLVPIIVGYFVAHYLSYFVEQGQQTLIQLSDPMVDGADLLGTADWSVGYWISYHPTVLATVKVLAIVVGHIVGAVAAHDRALGVLRSERRSSRTLGQLPMLLLMVAYTSTGLFLLFSS